MPVSVVTGANKGVGFGIVRSLCKTVGGTVILTSRNEERGVAAVQSLQAEGLNPVFEQLDICSDDSISKFCETIKSKYGGIDILCNNAGIAYKNASTAPLLEKAEVTCATNLLATIKITKSLLPLMNQSGRICQVASMAGTLNWSFPDLNNPVRKLLLDPALTEEGLLDIYNKYIEAVKQDDYSVFKRDSAYSISKCFLIAHTRILGREMKDNPGKVILNCCCPGYVDTDMTSHKGNLTIDQGAVTPVLVCTLPEGAGSGQFYREEKLYDWEHAKFM
ncbi:hypothetical protein ACHWQZ_G011151 [Mnemiopsis leidyi]